MARCAQQTRPGSGQTIGAVAIAMLFSLSLDTAAQWALSDNLSGAHGANDCPVLSNFR